MNCILVSKSVLRMEPENKLEAELLQKVWKMGILFARGETKDGKMVSVEIEV